MWAQQCGAWVICGPKNAGLSIPKHYEIHLRNAQLHKMAMLMLASKAILKKI